MQKHFVFYSSGNSGQIYTLNSFFLLSDYRHPVQFITYIIKPETTFHYDSPVNSSGKVTSFKYIESINIKWKMYSPSWLSRRILI